MPPSPVIVSLPTADRRTSFAFYSEGLGFDAVGELADDGLPEPLQFALNDGLRLMLIPTKGFGWVIGDREVAGRGQRMHAEPACRADAGVDELVERARQAGGEVVHQPGQQPWGYPVRSPTPTATSHGW